MADNREPILARLLVIAADIADVDEAVRNKLVGDDGEKRRVSVFEGAEEANEADPVGRSGTGPRIVRMVPQLIISALASSKEIGSDLNTLRGRLIEAIATDAELRSLTANGRGGRYIGMESDLAFGMQMLGKMALKFQFTYLLKF